MFSVFWSFFWCFLGCCVLHFVVMFMNLLLWFWVCWSFWMCWFWFINVFLHWQATIKCYKPLKFDQDAHTKYAIYRLTCKVQISVLTIRTIYYAPLSKCWFKATSCTTSSVSLHSKILDPRHYNEVYNICSLSNKDLKGEIRPTVVGVCFICHSLGVFVIW